MQSVQKQVPRDVLGEGHETEPITRDAIPNKDVHYTAFIRLPIPRGDFVDPPLVSLREPFPHFCEK